MFSVGSTSASSNDKDNECNIFSSKAMPSFKGRHGTSF